eukprot:1579071-Ditylum_brightwellii.AAC.1
MTVTNLSTANTNLTQQVANLTHNMTKKDTEFVAIKQSIDKLTEQLQTLSVGQAQCATPTPARNQSNRTAGEGRRQAKAGKGNPRQQQNTTSNMIQYCHSCSVTRDHGSRTCTTPKPGHQVGA